MAIYTLALDKGESLEASLQEAGPTPLTLREKVEDCVGSPHPETRLRKEPPLRGIRAKPKLNIDGETGPRRLWRGR